MSDKKYSLHEVTESLRISPDTLYRWESQIPNLKPAHCEGGRQYTGWEFDLLQHAHRLFHNYNQDFAGTRSALERWISKNPKPANESNHSSGDQQMVNGPFEAKGLVNEEGNGIAHKAHREREDSRGPRHVAIKGVDAAESVDDESSHDVSMPSPTANTRQQDQAMIDPLDLTAPEVVQQEGGKRRVIGRTDEDLFADLDSDPFDLSPRNDRPDPFELDAPPYRSTRSSDSSELSPALTKLERSFSSTTLKRNESTRREQPSSSDWLEGSTSAESRAVSAPKASITNAESKAIDQERVERPHFEPKRAFTQSKVASVKDNSDSVTSIDEPKVSSPVIEAPEVDPVPPIGRASKEPKLSALKPIPIRRTENTKENTQGTRGLQTPYGSANPRTTLPRTQNSLHRPSLDPPTSSSPNNLILNPQSSPFKERTPSSIPHPTDPKDQESWQRAYHHSQAQLARAKGDLAKAQDINTKQKKEIKRLQAQLLSVRESILKEIYDLRDLVVDK